MTNKLPNYLELNPAATAEYEVWYRPEYDDEPRTEDDVLVGYLYELGSYWIGATRPAPPWHRPPRPHDGDDPHDPMMAARMDYRDSRTEAALDTFREYFNEWEDEE